MGATDRIVTLRNDIVGCLHQQAAKKSPAHAYRLLENQIAILRDAMFLTYRIPGVRYWQPPGVCSPFATPPGVQPHRADVVELAWHEFVSRYGDPNDL